jgi:tetratricopeptide (TPR) repeat protein
VSIFRRLTLSFAVVSITWGCGLVPVWAGDPFRVNNPRPQISDRVQAAFEAIFKQGDYPGAKIILAEIEPGTTSDPLPYALRAAIAYTEKDWETLQTYSRQTLTVAEALMSQDPLRANLYLAVGSFLEGTYTYKSEGALATVTKMKQVLQYLDQAERIAPSDPELNIIRGYVDLALAGNLPFSSPTLAIDWFEQNAAPPYLVHRGIALAYRDLNRYDQALIAVNKALEATPANPELYYLRGQILYRLGKQQDNSNLIAKAVASFDLALEKANQLPESVVRTITKERNAAQGELEQF